MTFDLFSGRYPLRRAYYLDTRPLQNAPLVPILQQEHSLEGILAAVTFIVNPAAGADRAGRNWPALEARLRDTLEDCRAQIIPHPGAIVGLVRKAVEAGARTIIAIGGDGTAHDVLNGLMAGPTSRHIAFGLLPLGTGSDFARSLFGKDPFDSAFEAVIRGEASPVDLGRITYLETGRTRYFLNSCSFGLSARVAKMVNEGRVKRVSGSLAYLISAARALMNPETFRMLMTIDDIREERLLSLGAVLNGRFAGGGLRLAPDAMLDDGRLNLVTVGPVTVLDLVLNARRLFREGIYAHPRVSHSLFTSLTVLPPTGSEASKIPVEVDGEVSGHLPAKIEVLPGALRLVR